MSGLELKKFMLDEFSKATFKGFKVVDFWIDQASTRFIISVEQSTVAFMIKNDDQFQVLSVVHHGKERVDEDHLHEFEDFVAAVAVILNPIVKEKMAEYEKRINTVEYREEQAKLKEEHLEKRALTLEARAQVLEFQMQAIDVESQFLEDEKARNEAQRVRRWTRENTFLLKWFIIGIAMVAILLILILI